MQAQRRNASTVLHNACLTAYSSLLLDTELLSAYSAVLLGMHPHAYAAVRLNADRKIIWDVSL